MAIDRLPIDDRQCIAVLRCAICGENATPFHTHEKGKVVGINSKYLDIKTSNTIDSVQNKNRNKR